MLLTLCVGALALLLIWDYICKRHSYSVFKKSRITGPDTLPLLGNGHQALHLGAETVIDYVGDCFAKYGKTFRMFILNECLVYTTEAKHFEHILSSTTLLEKGQLYQFLRPFLNDGLLLSVGSKWHARRKVFTTAFHFKVLEHYVAIMDRHSGTLVQQLQPHADGQQVLDMLEFVSLAALDIITETSMGVQVNAQSDPNFPYIKALKSVVYIQPDRMFKFSQRYNWLFRLTAPLLHRKLLNDIRIMHEFTDKVICERRAIVERALADGTYKPLSLADADIGKKSQMALLDILLQSSIQGASLSNADIREEVDTFMFEGDDTTSSGVSHALHLIARHPHVQAKLYEELQQVLGNDRTAPVTQAQLQELQYLECVIKETMRLYPPVPALGRYTHKDMQIGEQTIPANSSIYLVVYFAHRDAKFFPDPLSFKPERFLNDTAERQPFTYVPFSAGPKNCIGQKFAMLEMKTLISKVIRYYELLPKGEELKPMMNLILRSSTGMKLALSPRKT